MAKLVKHSNGRWYIHYADRDNGRSRELSTRTRDKNVAKERLAEFLASQAGPPPTEEITVSRIMDRYLNDRRGRVAGHNSLVVASKPVKAILGHYQPQHLIKDAVRSYTEERRDLGRSDGTIIKELKTLRAALNLAVREKWIETAPHVEVPARPAPKSRWLTRDEVEALIAAAKSPHMRLFLLLAVYTGARKAAILGLTWDRVSDDLKIVNYNLPGRPTNNKRRAIVPTTKRVQEALKEAQELAQSEYVIEFRGKGVASVKKAWQEALRQSGISHCTIHDLRRTCATWLVQAGVPTAKVARMLGDSEKMIEQVYGHHSPDYLLDAVSALEYNSLNAREVAT